MLIFCTFICISESQANVKRCKKGDVRRPSTIEWKNPAGGSLESGEDEITVILYSDHVDFSDFPDNTDPHWQTFVLVSGSDGNVIPDLTYAD